ncbi:hypothetical protein [Caballeronia zhejiangensis]|uniref:hypothetical protein n=1 Tax=Caballeronia zhejiangensis TaxID=871203 RepID=UPI00158B922E|nr:hypothetical protein [Caballeronia zhejiangensis]MCG7403000.1 hypothetical protein [Caballeronia zhejiangensis]MCI1043825.1 hypothetical protein [Caballeronia zhejiangensis]
MDYFTTRLQARQLYDAAVSAAEITVAARFGSAFDQKNVAHCIAFNNSLDALLADDPRMQFHGWDAVQLLRFAFGRSTPSVDNGG